MWNSEIKYKIHTALGIVGPFPHFVRDAVQKESVPWKETAPCETLSSCLSGDRKRRNELYPPRRYWMGRNSLPLNCCARLVDAQLQDESRTRMNPDQIWKPFPTSMINLVSTLFSWLFDSEDGETCRIDTNKARNSLVYKGKLSFV